MKKSDYFNKELTYIKNKNNVSDTKYLINKLPDYFFKEAASSTGKYHPSFAQGEGGLLRHTKLAVRIAYDLLENESIGNKFSDMEKDLIIMALILHDGFKYGEVKSTFTRFDHPLVVSKFIMENKARLKMKIEDIRTLCTIIESHMGPWTVDKYTKKEILPKPTSEIQKFVHMCDFLSSKKYLDTKFEGNEIKE